MIYKALKYLSPQYLSEVLVYYDVTSALINRCNKQIEQAKLRQGEDMG